MIEVDVTLCIPIKIKPVIEQMTQEMPRLTPREAQILQCIADGKGNKEIAEALHIGKRTVVFHVSSLLGKFRVPSRVELRYLTANANGHSVAPVKETPACQ
jgi:DNA-binding CsgD family transcriptional regulator